MDKQPVRVYLFICSALFLVLSCTESATETDPGPAVIEGRINELVSNSSSDTASVEGYSVSAATISNAGTLEAVGGTTAKTDADAGFTLSIPADAWADIKIDSRVILMVEGREGFGKTFITSDIISGIIVQAKPVTVESTVEADVLEMVVAHNEEGNIPNAEIEYAVNEVVAAELINDSAAVSNMAVVLAEQSQVKADYYEWQGIELDNDELGRLKHDIQVQLENRLFDLGNDRQDRQSAYNAFMESMANAKMNVGLEAFQASVVSELVSRMALTAVNGFSDQVVSELYRVDSYMTAVAMNRSVENQLETVNAGNSAIDISESAAAELESQLLNSVSIPVEDLRTFFAAYSAQVITAIENNDTEVSSTFVQVNDLINSPGGSKANFELALKNASEPDQVVEAYAQFSIAIRSEVNSSFSDLEEQAEDAYAKLLILLNIAS